MVLAYSIGRCYAPDDGGGGGEEIVVDPNDSAFEDGDDLDVVVDDAAPAKEKVEAPKVEVAPAPIDDAFLASQAAQSKALADGLAALGEGLKKQALPANVPQQQVGESDEEFWKRLEEESFKPGQYGKVQQEALRRQLGPIVGEFQNELLDLKKQLLVHDPELGTYYKRFKDEVEARVQATPRQRWHGNIYRDTLRDILVEKQPTLMAENMEQQIADAVAAKLKEMGIDPANPKAKPAAAVQALGGRSAPPAEKVEPAKKKLVFSHGDVKNMIELGLITSEADLRDERYRENVKAYAEKKSRGGK